jgi:hypothetical protein
LNDPVGGSEKEQENYFDKTNSGLLQENCEDESLKTRAILRKKGSIGRERATISGEFVAVFNLLYLQVDGIL